MSRRSISSSGVPSGTVSVRPSRAALRSAGAPAALSEGAARTASGRSSAVNSSPAVSTTARSMAFSSSRTLPGQPYASSASRPACEMPRTALPFLIAKRFKKCSAKSDTSPARSRKGGSTTWMTFNL